MHFTSLTELTQPVASLVQATNCRNCLVWGKFDDVAEAVRRHVSAWELETGYVVMNETAEVGGGGEWFWGYINAVSKGNLC